MSSKKRENSDSDSESDEIQESQAVSPNESMNDTTEGQSTLLNGQCAELKYKIKQIVNKLEEMEELFKNIALNANASENICHGKKNIAVDEKESSSFLSQLPLKSVEEVKNFDSTLSDGSEKYYSLVKSLYEIGSKGKQHIIYNMMKYLMSDKAASSYSLQGRSNNLRFISLRLYDAISVAARIIQPTITDQEIENTVSQYLKNAKSRTNK